MGRLVLRRNLHGSRTNKNYLSNGFDRKLVMSTVYVYLISLTEVRENYAPSGDSYHGTCIRSFSRLFRAELAQFSPYYCCCRLPDHTRIPGQPDAVDRMSVGFGLCGYHIPSVTAAALFQSNLARYVGIEPTKTKTTRRYW